MPKFRVCRTFVVESGHMLTQHPERCRNPHGHTRTIEVVVCGDSLDKHGMLVDFTALKLAVSEYIDQFDHAMAVHSTEPLLPTLKELYPNGIIVFDEEPTTEVFSRRIYEHIATVLRVGSQRTSESGTVYSIKPGQVQLERVRVWETPSSWAEYGS